MTFDISLCINAILEPHCVYMYIVCGRLVYIGELNYVLWSNYHIIMYVYTYNNRETHGFTVHVHYVYKYTVHVYNIIRVLYIHYYVLSIV